MCVSTLFWGTEADIFYPVPLPWGLFILILKTIILCIVFSTAVGNKKIFALTQIAGQKKNKEHVDIFGKKFYPDNPLDIQQQKPLLI